MLTVRDAGGKGRKQLEQDLHTIVDDGGVAG